MITELINDEHITLDYDDNRQNVDLDEYRLSIFDKNSHFIEEIYLNKYHLAELYKGLKDIDLQINNDL